MRVVIQNRADDPLTVTGLAVLRGQWAEKMAAQQQQEIQDTATWQTESRTIGEGTRAFVRLASVRGIATVTWNLPWVGGFDFQVNGPDGLRASTKIDQSEPDAVNVVVTFA